MSKAKAAPMTGGILGLTPKKGEAVGEIHQAPGRESAQPEAASPSALVEVPPLPTLAPAQGVLPPTAAVPSPTSPSPALNRVEPRPEAAPRTGITIRLLNSDGERLRTLAFQTKRTKQDLLDLAIREFLDRNGI